MVGDGVCGGWVVGVVVRGLGVCVWEGVGTGGGGGDKMQGGGKIS